MLDKAQFFRRRQYVLGPEYLNYEGWKRLKICEDFLLTIHPDLTTATAENRCNIAVLLGYAIDPTNPTLSDAEVLERFVADSISLIDVVNGLKKLSGRFVLIVKCSEGMWLFPDECALRQVTFCFDEHNSIWCASQAEILAERFGFRYDEEVISYRNSPPYVDSKEDFWLINDRTPFREIRYLLANHYLDLLQGTVERFWPVPGCIGELSVEESICLSTHILQNSIKAAVDRFDLKMGISAGSDSRRSLAAAKAVSDRIFFFTHTPLHHSTDMDVPAHLLPRLGIEHHGFEIQPMSTEFRVLYECSATWARERHGHLAHTALINFGPDATVLNSNLSEIHRCFYWLPKSKINGEGLALATGQHHRFARIEFQKWLDDAKPACEASGMNILVLFDYELRSRWAASAFYECDIAYETFNPYNNRYLSSLELSVDERYRSGQRLDYIIEQIKYMWPETLSEPINPERAMLGKLKRYILESLVHKTITPRMPLYQYLKYLKLKWMFHK